MTTAVYQIATVQTPRRDIDLFGPTTVRIDRAGVPILYLSAYVGDADRLGRRIVAGLAWLDDSLEAQVRQQQVAPSTVAEATSGVYALPGFVEDIDYAETLALAEDIGATDWKSWSASVVRRIELATTASQVAALQEANTIGLKLCPGRYRVAVGKALNDAWLITQDQAASA